MRRFLTLEGLPLCLEEISVCSENLVPCYGHDGYVGVVCGRGGG